MQVGQAVVDVPRRSIVAVVGAHLFSTGAKAIGASAGGRGRGRHSTVGVGPEGAAGAFHRSAMELR